VFLGHLRTWLDTPLSTLILAVPRFVRIQSGHDGQVQTIFEIDKMAVSALTLDASEN
jgi:hypothetical protein